MPPMVLSMSSQVSYKYTAVPDVTPEQGVYLMRLVLMNMGVHLSDRLSFSK